MLRKALSGMQSAKLEPDNLIFPRLGVSALKKVVGFPPTRMKLSSLLLLLASCAATLAQTTSLPPPRPPHLVPVAAANSRGNDPSIAVNPNNPPQVVAAFQPATVANPT